MRDKKVDFVKGILILCVVIGHSNIDQRIIDIIFWFHMPCFFMISGYLAKKTENETLPVFCIRNAKNLLIPYFFFFIIESICYRDFTLERVVKILYGGKRIGGVFWFITVLLIAKCVDHILAKHINKDWMWAITCFLLYILR